MMMKVMKIPMKMMMMMMKVMMTMKVMKTNPRVKMTRSIVVKRPFVALKNVVRKMKQNGTPTYSGKLHTVWKNDKFTATQILENLQ